MRSAAPPSTILIYAAGRLRYVLPFLISAFSEMTGVQIETRHGPAGRLRKRIEAGERHDIVPSAALVCLRSPLIPLPPLPGWISSLPTLAGPGAVPPFPTGTGGRAGRR